MPVVTGQQSWLAHGFGAADLEATFAAAPFRTGRPALSQSAAIATSPDDSRSGPSKIPRADLAEFEPDEGGSGLRLEPGAELSATLRGPASPGTGTA